MKIASRWAWRIRWRWSTPIRSNHSGRSTETTIAHPESAAAASSQIPILTSGSIFPCRGVIFP